MDSIGRRLFTGLLLSFVIISCAGSAVIGPIVKAPKGFQPVAVPVQGYEWDYIEPGYYVDIISTYHAAPKSDDLETKTILQDALVLKIDVPEGQRMKSTFYIAARPHDVGRIRKAISQHAILVLALRGEKDHKKRPEGTAVSFRTLLR